MMSPGGRKFALMLHVGTSVAWIGAVLAFLALAITGVTSDAPQTVRSAYIAAEIMGWTVIVPLAFAALISGLVMGLGTRWGLLRYYWVATKLGINLLSSYLLVSHMRPLGIVARIAASSGLAEGQRADIRVTLIVAAFLAILALGFATALSIFKPWGPTAIGVRAEAAAGRSMTIDAPVSDRRWAIATAIGAIVLVLVVLIRHSR